MYRLSSLCRPDGVHDPRPRRVAFGPRCQMTVVVRNSFENSCSSSFRGQNTLLTFQSDSGPSFRVRATPPVGHSIGYIALQVSTWGIPGQVTADDLATLGTVKG